MKKLTINLSDLPLDLLLQMNGEEWMRFISLVRTGKEETLNTISQSTVGEAVLAVQWTLDALDRV